MSLNKPGRCKRCGKPYSSTQHMRDCKGMSIHQRNTARAHRAGIQRASRHRAGVIFTGAPVASLSYYEDARPTPAPLPQCGEGSGVGASVEAQS